MKNGCEKNTLISSLLFILLNIVLSIEVKYKIGNSLFSNREKEVEKD